MSDLTRVLQAGGIAIGLYAGYRLGNESVRQAVNDDYTGEPVDYRGRIAGRDIEAPHKPQAPVLATGMIGAGAAAAGLGAILTLAVAPRKGWLEMARTGGGAALFAGGVAMAVGATGIAAMFDGAKSHAND